MSCELSEYMYHHFNYYCKTSLNNIIITIIIIIILTIIIIIMSLSTL